MSAENQIFYPGDAADPQQVLALAHTYARAAEALIETGQRGRPMSWLPFRLTAIHAIELYLNAALRAAGVSAATVRSMQHDLGYRVDMAAIRALDLRPKTTAHLHRISETREYLCTRYDPAFTQMSQLNRLVATLIEVAEKVTRRIDS